MLKYFRIFRVREKKKRERERERERESSKKRTNVHADYHIIRGNNFYDAGKSLSKKKRDIFKFIQRLFCKSVHACAYLCSRTIAISNGALAGGFLYSDSRPTWRNNFSTNRLRHGYDSTSYDHYNYATSRRLLMAILLRHLIAPADCFGQFSWILRRKREQTLRSRATRPCGHAFRVREPPRSYFVVQKYLLQIFTPRKFHPS
jgi:hypothetical protein